MSRFLCTVSAALLVIPLLTGIASAQDSASERVITGKRTSYPRFELEVLVDGRPLSEYRSRGRTYVEAVRGAEYELRLRNSSPDRVAVALSVDGLNTIDALQTAAWNASKWVIEPYQTITISGWQMSSERARRFYFTTERDSYAAKLGQRGDIGVISAVFFRERNRVVPMTRPSASSGAAEPKLRAEASRDSEAATGIGRSVRNDVREIDMELDSRPAAELTLKYEYSRREEYSRRQFCPEP
ncbi:MAG TPA: hypothetical protein VGJ37_00885 [Pyrinomonadaceae bacterium]